MAIEEVNGIFDPRPNASPATRETPKSKGTSAWWVADLSRDFRPLIRLKRRNAAFVAAGGDASRCKSGTMLRPVEVAKLERFAPIGPEDPSVLVAAQTILGQPPVVVVAR